MKKPEVTVVKAGEKGKFDEHADYIKLEGDNDVFFNAYSGTALNYKAQIVVPPTHFAIYVKNGKLQDVLESGMYPVYEYVKKGFLGIGKKFDAVTVDILFVNNTTKIQAKWGTDVPLILRDPITEQLVHVTGYGEFEAVVHNPKQFYLTIVSALDEWNTETLKKRLYARMFAYLGDALAKAMHNKITSFLDIQVMKKDIADELCVVLDKAFKEEAGLSIKTFTISDMGIQDDEMEMIEDELYARRRELKEKREAKELVAELERLEDRANQRKDYEEECKWKRELLLKELEYADKEKYYDVLKVLAEHSNNKFGNLDIKESAGLPKQGGKFCPSCGAPYEPGSKFCNKCGERLPGGKVTCPKCGKELDSGSKFCPECGSKI